MKKQLSGLLAIALAGAMCLGFAACGETTDGAGSGSAGDGAQTEQGGNQQGGNQQGGNQQGGNEQGSESGGNQQGGSQQPSLTKDTDFEALVSDKVTAAQWDAAFSNEAFSGCTSEYSQEQEGVTVVTTTQFSYQKNGEYISEMKITRAMEDAFEQHTLYVFEENAVNVYIKGKGEAVSSGTEPDVWYLHTIGKDDADWEAVHSEETVEFSLSFRMSVAYDFAGQFDKFAYDETLHAYTYEGDTVKVEYTPMEKMSPIYTVTNATLKFSGGKLAYAKVKVSNGREEVYKYYDYGKLQITVPTDAQPSPRS